MSTKVSQFIVDLDGGVFEEKLASAFVTMDTYLGEFRL